MPKDRKKTAEKMAEKPSGKQAGYMKKESVILVALVCLVAGFVAGVLFTVYKTGSGSPAPSASSPGQQASPERPELAQQIRELEKKVAENPADVEAWTQLGNHYFDTDQAKKSIQAYQRSLELRHNSPDVWTDMGVMYRRDGQPKKAIEAFDTAIEIDPRHETARFNKGIVLLHDLNDREAALDAWEKLAEVNPQAKAPNGQPIRELIQSVKENPKG